MSIHIDRSKLLEALRITPSKQVIAKQTLEPNVLVTLLPATQYKHTVILFHGDGDPEVKHTVKVNNTVIELLGDEQAIELLANESLEVTATNTSTTEAKNTMTIEILYLTW